MRSTKLINNMLKNFSSCLAIHRCSNLPVLDYGAVVLRYNGTEETASFTCNYGWRFNDTSTEKVLTCDPSTGTWGPLDAVSNLTCDGMSVIIQTILFKQYYSCLLFWQAWLLK